MNMSNRSIFKVTLMCLPALFCAVEAFAIPVVRKINATPTSISAVSTSNTPNTSNSGSRIGVVKAIGSSSIGKKGLSTVKTSNAPSRMPVAKSIKSFNIANVSGLSKKSSSGTTSPSSDLNLDNYYTKIEVDDVADTKLNITDLVGDNEYVYVEQAEDGTVVVGLDMDALADKLVTQQAPAREGAVVNTRVVDNTKIQWQYNGDENWRDIIDLASIMPDVDSLQNTIMDLIDNIDNEVELLTRRVEALETQVETLNTQVQQLDTTKANAGDVYNKTETYNKTEIDNKIIGIQEGKKIFDTKTQQWTYVEIEKTFDPNVLE